MASATQQTVKLTTLILTNEELYTLALILRNVGGYPKNSPRGFCDDILEAIREYVPNVYYITDVIKEGKDIYFEDNSLNTFLKQIN